jgi:hypothetical protein
LSRLWSGSVAALVELEHAVHARDALVEGHPVQLGDHRQDVAVEASSEVPIACMRRGFAKS